MTSISLEKAAEALGYTLHRSKVNTLFLRKNGRFFNPFRTPKSQRDDSYYKNKVKELRERGVRDEIIFDALRRREKLSVEKIKKLFKLDSLILGIIPESFKNLEGGANAGKNLFTRVNTEILRLRAENRKMKNPLSKTELTDKTINFLMEQPEYTSQANMYKEKGETKSRKQLSTIQAKMIIDLSKKT